MGMVLGKICVETPKYTVIESKADYEILHRSIWQSAEHQAGKDRHDRSGDYENHPTAAEKIAMTAPVVTKSSGAGDEKKLVTMQFLLPSTYQKAEDAPKPSDERVVIVEEGERKYGVVRFGGVATDEVVAEKVEKLKKNLERDGHKVIGDYVLARYNPPFTLPMFRTNEVMIPIE
ncbi:hypothetical protein FNV43_RR09685 [Rhamnella rubrinervis]|uniref:SOUL heme-binding protein n=1 Tax=Rhamnella rubrinervis TaxID=2594499 RepID=A0A8K0HBS9_9ROSA|nr:hypothetical protein FNV43_RR09685 [Rhamnella rubrinervis]